LDLSPGYPGKFVDIFSPFFLKQKTVAIICIATQKGSVQQELHTWCKKYADVMYCSSTVALDISLVYQ
jgi:hypothetical protein